MQVWNVLHASHWKCRAQKWRKNSPSSHHRTTLSGYILATKACINNRKKTCWTAIPPPHPHSMVNFGPLVAQVGWRVWGTPANFNGFRILVSLLHQRRSAEVSQTLHDVWPSPGLVHYIYIFGGSCPVTEFCQLQNSLCVQVLRSPILAALLHGTWAPAVNQTLWRGTRNGITELSQRVPPIFGWAAITLGIGPHSSFSWKLRVTIDIHTNIIILSVLRRKPRRRSLRAKQPP